MSEVAYQRVLRKALNFLSYQPRSRYEIERSIDKYLKKESLVLHENVKYKENLLIELNEFGYIDDRKVVKAYVQNALVSSKPRSKRSVFTFILNKNIDTQLIEEEIIALDDEFERKSINKEIQKRQGHQLNTLSNLDKRNLTTYLIKKGYTTFLVYDAVNET